MNASTNLARRPFRNERLPWLLAGTLTLVALLVTVAHGRFVSRLVAGDEARTVLEVRQGEARIAQLERDIAQEPPVKVDGVEFARLRAYKELVDLRVFPWRPFLSALEEILSGDVRLIRISPAGPRGREGMLIELTGEARSKDAAFSFAEGLDASPLFSNSVLTSLSETETETEFNIEVVFNPTIPATQSPRAKDAS